MQALLNWIIIVQHELCNDVSTGACCRTMLQNPSIKPLDTCLMSKQVTSFTERNKLQRRLAAGLQIKKLPR